MCNKKQLAQRIASYSAAAGLGAFGFGEAANAVIVYTDIPDVVLNRGDEAVFLNLDGAGDDDLKFWNSASGYGPASVRFQGIYGTIELSNSYGGGNADYYVRAFELDQQIGPIGYGYTVDPSNPYGIMSSNSSNFGDPFNPRFAGFQLEDPDGGLHFGWARVRHVPVDGDPTTLEATLFDWAYESELDTPILAGAQPDIGPGDFNGDGTVDGDDFLVWQQGFGTIYDGDDFLIWQQNFGGGSASGAIPEPTSLALLAAGAGALALRFRRCNHD